ncbi:LysR family transcriptional regulator [Arthrobacter sp. MYb224]|uniref:LysR family transcriptional regulator n=1 Tax=Arthrobacter sp. MYb224 TaxID=1848600 RepID=UPI000CFB855E|nr:LysR family transcriptional regulator [Arthrobacter sp. MYb224]PQZ96990.1 LysR family transcriptional regulator [Arthrobacter sp. MYb224]
MLLTQLEYFVALAREKHFGHAAAACFVSPSALSEAIRKLETELGVPLVTRGRNFEGLTTEGQQALIWAQKMVANQHSMLTELSAARGNLTARIRVGAIPAGGALAASVLSQLGRQQHSVTATLSTGLSSEQIMAKLRRFELEAGVILPSAADGPDILAVAISEISHVVVAPHGVFPAETKYVTGSMLRDVPLALLSPAMRARQQLDLRFAEHGIELRPRFDVDSVEALLNLVAQGPWVTVIPESAITKHPPQANIRVLPLTEPHVAISLAVVRLAQKPVSAISRALDSAIGSVLPAI